MRPPYTISLAMIVRDEARSIVRCLDSVREAVDEMVVVDTGSVDDTVELAEMAGARVERFGWVDDFAAARNYAISRCTGDWVLVMDADEWLAPGTTALRDLRSTRPGFAGIVDVVSDTGEGSASLLPQARLFPADTRYVGRVHEQPRLEVPARKVDVRIEHDGYLPEQRARKVGRNQALLEAALLDDPENAYLWYQLAREHDAQGGAAAALVGFEQAGRLMGPSGPQSPGWRHHLVVRHVACLVMAGRSQDAIDLAFGEFQHWQHSADFQFMLGQALLKHVNAHPDLAAEVLPLAEGAWRTCLELGDSGLTGAVTGHGSFLAARELVRLYEWQGRTAEAEQVRALAQPAR
jgi:Glycosyl transferase family 2